MAAAAPRPPKISVASIHNIRSFASPSSPTRHIPVADSYAWKDPSYHPQPEGRHQEPLASMHAIHGNHRHLGGRWHSTLANVEVETGPLRRKLEGIERHGIAPQMRREWDARKKKHVTREHTVPGRGRNEPWKVRVQLVDKYNARALTLLRGSGFVEAYHLMQSALELSLYNPSAGHLTIGDRGIGALPENRGTRLTALTLNNLAVYHRRRGQGRTAYRHLQRAQEVEADDPAVSTQTNLCVLATELLLLRAAVAHLRAAVRRMADEHAMRERQPVERSAVVAVAAYNLAVALESTHPHDLRDLNLLGASEWCLEAAVDIANRDLGPSHPVSLAFRDPLLLDDGPGSRPRRVRLGRSVLGQLVDGATYSVGWPQFTLIDLQEEVQAKLRHPPGSGPARVPRFEKGLASPSHHASTVSMRSFGPSGGGAPGGAGGGGADALQYSYDAAGVPLPPPLGAAPPTYFATAHQYPLETAADARPQSAPAKRDAPPPPGWEANFFADVEQKKASPGKSPMRQGEFGD